MKMQRKVLLKTNLELWLNDLMLRKGLYTSISAGDTNVGGDNISQLISIEDEDFVTGQVWQSAFKNWVYEEGIPSPSSGVLPPIVASGITVDGTFYPEATTSGAFAHFIDFPNGRVVFTSAISTASVVEGTMSYKEVTVDQADRFNNEAQPLLLETAYKDNPNQDGVQTYPSKTSRTLPAIWIDLQGRKNTGYELGSKSLVSEFVGVFHVWGRDSYLRDVIEDALLDAQRDVLLGIDFNTAPYHLLSRGRRNPAWPGYAVLANVHSPNFWRRIYLEETEARKDQSLFEVERTQVRFLIRIFPNF